MYKQIAPIIDNSVRELCTKPYPGHLKGCPNHGKRPSCPPQAPLLKDILILHPDVPIYIVWNKFPLWEHVAKLKYKHPDWSDRQLYCCLYWQGKARKQLREEVQDVLIAKRNIIGMPFGPPLIGLSCPEAQGVNVTATMKAAGVNLEWPPREFAYQVALVGYANMNKLERIRAKNGR